MSVGGVLSSEQNITCGVPQGSILGPILFLTYINDINNATNLLNINLFADDTSAVFSHSNIQDLFSIMTQELEQLQIWLHTNRLSLNINKTKYMLVKNNSIKTPCYNPTPNLSGLQIEQVHHFKFLGIIFNDKLNWKSHINYICKKVSRNVGLINHIKHSLNRKALFILYYSLIYPYLSYANALWGNTYATHLNVLFLLQKRAIRVISLSKRLDHTQPLFKKFNILTLSNINIFSCLIISHNFVHHPNHLPSVFKHFFTRQLHVHYYVTRGQTHNLYKPIYKSNLSLYFLKIKCPREWNKLPANLKIINSLSLFKSNLKKYLSENDQ